MENAVDALKQAAAVLIFVSALALTIFVLTRAKQAASAVMSQSNSEYYNTDNIKVTSNRIVGIETVIPTLYSYYKEGYTILFYKGKLNNNGQQIEGNITPLTLYYSEALPEKLAKSKLLSTSDTNYKAVVNSATGGGKSYSRAIYGFDLDDESTRDEPWIRDESHAKEFMKSFINNLSVEDDLAPKYDWSRSKFKDSPNDLKTNKLVMNFNTTSEYGFIKAITSGSSATSLSTASNATFVERVGIYNMISEEGDIDQTTNQVSVNTTEDSSVTSFSNGETIENEEGTQKRVIQYIFIGNN